MITVWHNEDYVSVTDVDTVEQIFEAINVEMKKRNFSTMTTDKVDEVMDAWGSEDGWLDVSDDEGEEEVDCSITSTELAEESVQQALDCLNDMG